MTASPFWTRSVHADRRPFLLGRNKITSAFRNWFEGRDFVEVDPCQLQISPGNEAHVHAFQTEMILPDGGTRSLYLHTSPEFSCKKLLAAGEERLFTFAHVFRNRERGALHHPEFTMLEWYRAGQPYTALMDDCAELIALAAEVAGARRFSWRGKEADPFAPPERISVAEAFKRWAGIELLATLDNVDALKAAARTAGIRVAPDDTWSDVFSRVLVERVEPHLGQGRLTVLDEYPVCEAALARPSAHDPRVSERFEIYMCGVELANAFGELTDAVEQRRRFELEMAEKQRVYGEHYPVDEDFLTALAFMPAASGCALGFDRLVMLATGALRVDQVMWVPVAE
jgi:lysyl-tRNA synthetase class 2